MFYFKSSFTFKLGRLLSFTLVILLVPLFCFGDSSVEQLIQNRLSKDKKTLDLSGAKIGPKGAKTLAGMELLSEVETLLLQGNKIKYRGIMLHRALQVHMMILQYLEFNCLWFFKKGVYFYNAFIKNL